MNENTNYKRGWLKIEISNLKQQRQSLQDKLRSLDEKILRKEKELKSKY